MPLSRRHVLAFGSLSALAAAGGVGLVAGRWWDRPPAEGLRHLSAGEAAFILALAGTAFPATPQIDASGDTLDLDQYFDATLDKLPASEVALLKLGLHVLDASPRLSHGARFVDLSEDARSEVLTQWREHARPELRQALSSLLLVVGMGFCTHPRVAPFFEAWHRCGYGR